MPPARRDLKIFEIGPDENDSCGNGRGQDTNTNRNAAVKPYPRRFDRTVNRGLESQASSPGAISLFHQLTIVSSSF